MDFVSGALPNVMFIAGIVAIGIALGIEFKIVEIKGQLSKGGRIGTFALGIALIAVSVHLYTAKPTQSAAGTTPTAIPQPTVIQANVVAAARPAVEAPSPSAVPQPTPTSASQAESTGTPFAIQGVIKQLTVQNNQVVVVINKTSYALPADQVGQFGQALQVGSTLKLAGTQLTDGTLIVTNIMLFENDKKPDENERHEDD